MTISNLHKKKKYVEALLRMIRWLITIRAALGLKRAKIVAQACTDRPGKYIIITWKALEREEETDRGNCCRGGSIQSDQDAPE